jgi:hypothetical protein
MIKYLIYFTITLLIISCDNKKLNKGKDDHNSINEKLTNEKPAKDYFKLGEVLMNKETIGDIRIGMTQNEVIRQYGTPDEITKPVFSDVDGGYYQSIEYKSKGLSVGINADSTKEVVWIEIKKPSELKTSKHIGIGSSYLEASKAYKDYIEPGFEDPRKHYLRNCLWRIIFFINEWKG